ncbi:MAG: ribose-5-phosphate isomerase A, partial [Acetobacteraceae bacterium]
FVVIADASKLVARLGTLAPVPVEIARFAHAATARRLERSARIALESNRDAIPGDNGERITPLETTEESVFSHAANASGARAVLRLAAGGEPFVTDNGNFIYDLHGLAPIADPRALERDLVLIPGVVESGLFTLPVRCAFIGSVDGTVRALKPRGKDRPIGVAAG